MSALPPKADIRHGDQHVRFVPIADITRLRPTEHQRGRLHRLFYADAISKVGSCSTLNDTERAIKHFLAAASCRRRAMFSSEPAASLACGRNVTLANCPAPSARSISTPEASSLYATTTIPASAQRCRYQS